MAPPPLPYEILYDILSLALWDHNSPLAILLACPTFYSIGRPLLYADLRFTSVKQIELFSHWHHHDSDDTQAPVPFVPHSITIDIASRASKDDDMWTALKRAMLRCVEVGFKKSGALTLRLKHLHLHVHSHSRRWELSPIQETLSLVRYASHLFTVTDTPYMLILSKICI